MTTASVMSGNQNDGGDRGDEQRSEPGGQGGGQPPGGPGGQPQGGQQPGHPPQGGAQGAPPGGGQPVRRGPSASQKVQAAFGDYAVKNQIKAVVGLWALIGLGLGLTPVLLGLLGPGGGVGAGLGGLIGFGLALGAGPIVSGLVGLSLSNKLPVDAGPAGVVSGVTNYVGFVVMVLVFGILMMIQASGSGAGGGGQLGQVIAPLLLTGIPVAVTAGGVTALGQKVNYPATREEAEAQEPPTRQVPPGGAQQPQQP